MQQGPVSPTPCEQAPGICLDEFPTGIRLLCSTPASPAGRGGAPGGGGGTAVVLSAKR
jgi:hypothetical protein